MATETTNEFLRNSLHELQEKLIFANETIAMMEEQLEASKKI